MAGFISSHQLGFVENNQSATKDSFQTLHPPKAHKRAELGQETPFFSGQVSHEGASRTWTDNRFPDHLQCHSGPQDPATKNPLKPSTICGVVVKQSSNHSALPDKNFLART